jgi:hypothetical protein
MADHKVVYEFNFSGNLNKGLLNITGSAKKATSATSRLMERIKNLASIGMVAGNVGALYGKLSNAIASAEKAYNAQAVSERQLERVMRNTIGATDGEIQSIKDLASAQQKLGVIGDEIQLAGAKELGTYITKTESLKKLMPMMNDMLAHQYGLNASQENAVQIAQMVGKVLDGQTGALSRAGYRFSEAQENVLKFGDEEQRVALLSKIVTQYVGGVNAALAATPEGKLKQHANNMGDLKERVGGLVVAVKQALLPLQTNIAGTIEKLVAYFEANRERLMETVSIIARVVSATFGSVISVFKGLFTVLSKTWKLLLSVAAAVALYKSLVKVNNLYTKVTNGLLRAKLTIGGLLHRMQKLENREVQKNTLFLRANSIAKSVSSIATNVAALSSLVFARAVRAATAAVRGLSRAIYAIPIIGWIAAAIAGIVALFKILWDRSRKFRELLFGIWGAAKAVFHNIGVVAKRLWEGFLKPIFTLWWKLAKFVYGGIWDGIKSAFSGIVSAAMWLWGKLSAIFTWVKEAIIGAFTSALGWLKSSGGVVGSFVYKWIVDPVSKAFSALWGFIKDIFSWIGRKLAKIFAPITAFFKKLFSTEDMQDVSDAYADGARAGGEHFDKSKAQGQGDESAFALPTAEGIGKSSALPTFGDAGDGATSIATAGGKSTRNLSISINKLVENITISVTNMREGAEQIKAQVAEALLTAVNDVNLAS